MIQRATQEKSRLPAVMRLARVRTRAMLRENGFEPLLQWLPSQPARPRSISIIVPAHNEEAYLAATLESVSKQKYPNFEVVVVANGCTDRTPAAARGRCDTLVVVSKKGLGLARNLGAKLARGDVLVFLDADTALQPGALRMIGKCFTHEFAAATLRGEPDEKCFAYRLIYFLKNFTHRWKIHNGSSGILICWKEHFMQIGGFDEALNMRENSHLIKRLRQFGKYRYIRQAAVVTSMRRYAKKGFGRAVSLWLGYWIESIFGDLRYKSYETVR